MNYLRISVGQDCSGMALLGLLQGQGYNQGACQGWGLMERLKGILFYAWLMIGSFSFL